MHITDLSASQLNRAAAIKERMEKLQAQLTRILDATTPTPAAPAASRKRTMSAAARALISAAQKQRWAAQKSKQVAPQPNARRGMSAAAKKKLSEFHKARWARIKGSTTATTAKPATQKKFTMSASAKAAISKAAKARWARIRAAKQAK